MAFGYYYVPFGIVISRKGDSAKVSSHYFTLFPHFAKLVIYAFMDHDLTSIDILCVYMSLNLLAIYVIACCIVSDM